MGVVSISFRYRLRRSEGGQAGGEMDAHQDMRTPLAWATPSGRGHG